MKNAFKGYTYPALQLSQFSRLQAPEKLSWFAPQFLHQQPNLTRTTPFQLDPKMLSSRDPHASLLFQFYDTNTWREPYAL